MAGVVAVVGSRDYPDLDKVRDYVCALPYGTVVVSGGAKGVDSVARRFASRYKGFHIESWEWQHFGKRAAAIRNKVLIHYVLQTAGRVVIFSKQDEQGNLTPGSDMVRRICQQVGVPWEVIS